MSFRVLFLEKSQPKELAFDSVVLPYVAETGLSARTAISGRILKIWWKRRQDLLSEKQTRAVFCPE
jgi:hypothetical protein